MPRPVPNGGNSWLGSMPFGTPGRAGGVEEVEALPLVLARLGRLGVECRGVVEERRAGTVDDQRDELLAGLGRDCAATRPASSPTVDDVNSTFAPQSLTTYAASPSVRCQLTGVT